VDGADLLAVRVHDLGAGGFWRQAQDPVQVGLVLCHEIIKKSKSPLVKRSDWVLYKSLKAAGACTAQTMPSSKGASNDADAH
jgi:hypothetical protein